MKARLAALAASVLAVTACVALVDGAGALTGREFRARARAYPVEPDPGQNERTFSVRPVSVDAGISSAPRGANGRAASFDAGFAENQPVNGRPLVPEESYARCDTVSPNVPDEQERLVGSMMLAAHCTEGPAVDIAADGGAPAAFLPPEALAPLGVEGGVLASRARAEATGSSVIAEAVTGVSDLTVGPLHIENLRFRARVEVNGRAGGARADWSVEAMAADVGGVPVIIGTDGVTVDKQKVPAPLLDEATRGVQEGFAQSGFVDVRLVQPEQAADADGSSAGVRGGALSIFMTSSDNPADRSFLGLTLLGSSVSAHAGPAIAAPPALEPFATGGALVGMPLDARPASPTVMGRTTAPAPARAAPAPEAPTLVRVAGGSARRTLPTASSWWLAPLVSGLALAFLAVGSSRGPLLPARRRIEAWWHAVAEGYLRG